MPLDPTSLAGEGALHNTASLTIASTVSPIRGLVQTIDELKKVAPNTFVINVKAIARLNVKDSTQSGTPSTLHPKRHKDTTSSSCTLDKLPRAPLGTELFAKYWVDISLHAVISLTHHLHT